MLATMEVPVNIFLRSLGVSTLILAALGCPEERKKIVDEVGSAPKAQIQDVQKKLDLATQKANQRLEEVAE